MTQEQPITFTHTEKPTSAVENDLEDLRKLTGPVSGERGQTLLELVQKVAPQEDMILKAIGQLQEVVHLQPFCIVLVIA